MASIDRSIAPTVAPIASLLKLSFKILENSRLEFSCQIQLQVDILFMDYPISGQNFSHKDSLFEFLDQSFVRKFKLRVHKVLSKVGLSETPAWKIT